MKVAVTLDHRFFRTEDGVVWTDGVHSYPFWKRYLAVFDGVKVVARVRNVLRPQAEWCVASGAGVRFLAMPDYQGPWQYLARSVSAHRAIREAVSSRDAVIMRVSSHIAGCLVPALMRRAQPYGLQVVNDPFDEFAPKAVDYLFRPLFREHFTRQLRRQCERASAAAYVTERALQSRYPCPHYAAAFSDVEITAEALLDAPRTFSRLQNPAAEVRLITVASLAQMYKAPDVLLRGIAAAVEAGLNLKLCIVGDGRHRAAMEGLSVELGLSGRVNFRGQLPAGVRVREALDAADLFVLPSRTEGLPRALIEAMARSLPCIASNVGGIPELLAAEDLVAPGDVDSLTRKLMELRRSPDRLDAMAGRNLRRAGDFSEDLLALRRNAFFREVRRMTSQYIQAAGAGQKTGEHESARRQL